MTQLAALAPVAACLLATISQAFRDPISSASLASSITSSVNLTLISAIVPPLPPPGGSCKYHPGGGKCPKHAPCCMNGYCSDNPRFCSTGCEPQNSWRDTSCFPIAFCTNIREEFNQPRLADSRSYTGNPYQFDFLTEYNMDGVQIQDSKLKIAMKLDRVLNSFGRPQGLGSVVSTTRFMQYGKVVARIKTGSSSPGVVSAFILRNEEPGDEIDFEIVGRDPAEAQTNFYYRTPPYTISDLVDYSNAGKTPLGLNTALDFHDYEIEWLPDYISWKIDGRVVRSVFRNQTKDDELVVDPATGLKAKKFPSTPARIQFGIWDGGQGSNGTAAWAGTPTDWSKPDQTYEIQIDYVDIQCYYGGNTTQMWPPAGYGPTKVHKGPYITPGLEGTGGGEGEIHEPIRPFVPFYKNPMLMVPTGCLVGFALVVMGTVEVVRRRQLARVRWE